MCNVGCMEICGVLPTKNHREKNFYVATRWVNNFEENLNDDSPYVLVMVLFSPWLR